MQVFYEFNALEHEIIHKTFISLLDSKVLAKSSSEEGFILMLKRELSAASIIGDKVPENSRNQILLLNLLKLYFLNEEIALNNNLIENTPSEIFCSTISKLLKFIIELIDSIIITNSNDFSSAQCVLVRPLMELSWLTNIFAFYPERIPQFIDTSIDEYQRWKKYFNPKLLRQSMDEINDKVLAKIPDYIDYLHTAKNEIYKKYSQYIHIGWESFLEHKPNVLNDVAYSLWYSMALYHYTIVYIHKLKYQITSETIISSTVHSILIQLTFKYLPEYKWD
jgi:hypothetical protein